MKGKELLKEAGMLSFARKCVYEEIQSVIEKNNHLNYFTETFGLFNKEITFIYDNESDPDLENCDSELDYVEIYDVKVFDIEKLLKDNNINYQKSNRSESVYFHFNGNEYRISTHKRPAYEDAGGVWHEWEYTKEYICENEKDMYETIEFILGGENNENIF